MKRIDWTEYEQAQVYAATVDLLDNRKVALPVEGFKGGKAFMQAIRDAQVALPEKRRRPLASIDAVSGDLRKRFIDAGILPRDIDSLRRGADKKSAAPEAPDPKDERIAELEQQVSRLEDEVSSLEQANTTQAGRIAELEARPDAMTVVQQWVARTLSLALIAADDAKKPAAMRVEPQQTKEALPQFEKDRRKDPVAAAAGSARPFRAKVAVIGGQPQDHASIAEHLADHADLRYFSPQPSASVMDAIKGIAGSGGTVLLWSDHASHQVESQLKARVVQYHRHSGNLTSLIERIKGFIITQRNKHEGKVS
jgi:hypothetical protein